MAQAAQNRNPQRSTQKSKPTRLKAVEQRDHVGRITPTAALCTIIVASVVFGALAVQISLINRQVQLDTLRVDIAEMQLANKRLGERESRVQSPDEILRIAEDDLGMVKAAPPALVTPEITTIGAIPIVGDGDRDGVDGSSTTIAEVDAARVDG